MNHEDRVLQLSAALPGVLEFLRAGFRYHLQRPPRREEVFERGGSQGRSSRRRVHSVGHHRPADRHNCQCALYIYNTCVGSVLNEAHQLQVVDSKGHSLFQKEDATKGKFAFTTEDYDVFEVCFVSVVTSNELIFSYQDDVLVILFALWQVVATTVQLGKSTFP